MQAIEVLRLPGLQVEVLGHMEGRLLGLHVHADGGARPDAPPREAQHLRDGRHPAAQGMLLTFQSQGRRRGNRHAVMGETRHGGPGEGFHPEQDCDAANADS